MRLWLDGQCLQTGSRFRGIGRYVTEFIAGVAQARPDVELVVSLNAAMAEEAITARAILAAHVAQDNIHIWQGLAEGGEGHVGYTERRRLSEAALAHHVALLAPDIALSASPFEGGYDVAVPYFPLPQAQTRAAAIFYDAIPYRFPERYFASASAKDYFDRRLKKLSAFGHVLAISAFSLSELRALAPSLSGTNIEAAVAPSFVDLVAAQARGTKADVWPRDTSVLYVGGLDWRKNVTGAAQAFAHLPETLKQRVHFLVAGHGPSVLGDEIRQAWHAAGMPAEHLRLLGHVDDAALVRLYRTAGVVIQPSIMEGFGLTTLEAMHCGAPVIASRGGALAEVVSSKQALFNPYDVRDIGRKITRALTDETFARGLVEEGQAQAARFSWKKTAETAVAALERALPERAPAANGPALHTQARALALRAVAPLALEPDLVARAMATAEPVQGVARLLVDTTATCDADHGTGIQRVVKKIAANLMQREADATLLIYGKTDEGFFEARVSETDGRLAPDHETRRHVPLLRGDTVLMLDSSWEHHLVHGRVLPRALLQGCDVVTTLYDLVPVRTPAFCDPGMPGIFAAWLQSALGYSTAFVCISKAVADELMALLHAIEFPRPMKVGYWTLGADFAPAPPAAPRPRSDRRALSFLMVGTIEPRKGYGVALAAFEQLWRQGVDATLTIIGRRGWGVDGLVERILAHPQFGDRLIWMDRASDADLIAAYGACDALISASFAEGFGLPIVEAGHFHKPIIASDLPVFREVARHAPAAQFFATGDSGALAHAVQTFAARRATPARMDTPVEASWAQSAEQLSRIVRDGAWQMRYAPRAPRHDVARADLGVTRMVGAVLDGDAARLELVEGPMRGAGEASFEIVVRAVNGTDTVWSSLGPRGDDDLGVMLECQMVDAEGRPLAVAPTHARLPWVMPPDAPHYLRIITAPDCADAGAVARIVLRQTGGGELCRPLLVALPGAAAQAPRAAFAGALL